MMRNSRPPASARVLFACAFCAVMLAPATATPEYNPVRTHPISIGPEADRLIIGFRAPAESATTQFQRLHAANTRPASAAAADVTKLAARTRLKMTRSRQLTSNAHVVYLEKKLYGADVTSLLAALRADPAVKYAEVDQHRYAHAAPDDPLFTASSNATGQWYMMAPSLAGDAAATDAISAWNITTGSGGTVIADIDTGVRFEHPDLLRAGLAGRLLPGYDFVSEDQNPSNGAALGTFLIANDGDGWDPDPSDPGDWINSSDQANTTLFPAADCATADSSWHGTRVMGILGALTNNGIGVAGMTWNPYLLPVRALGKCGGYDSDIIAGMQWAAGLAVTGVVDNPYPASIINLSLGGTGSCPAAYADEIATLTAKGVLIVASAGNASGPVDAPANCPGVLAVAGLRNVGTKVGYSSLGKEVGIAAPAGNCINISGACLRSIDTTTNSGLTVPGESTYTSQTNPNLGTSFAAPIVAGVAALMRAVNANLTPPQLIARIESSASAFPQPVGLPVCPMAATDGSGECACPNDATQCGAGMLNASAAVSAALRPIAAVTVPATSVGSSAVLSADGSAASCGRTISTYAWTASGGVTIQPGTAAMAKVTVTPTGTSGSLTLTVTDSAGSTDTATLAVDADGAVVPASTTPANAGTSAGACPVATTIALAPPAVALAFLPTSVAQNVTSTLTMTLGNANEFALTQANLVLALPTNLVIPASTTGLVVATSTCAGVGSPITATASTIVLSGAILPANSSCTVTVSVQSATAGAYTTAVPAAALTTGPAGANAAAAAATLTVTAPSKSGGGALDRWDMLFAAGVLLAGRRYGRRRPPP